MLCQNICALIHTATWLNKKKCKTKLKQLNQNWKKFLSEGWKCRTIFPTEWSEIDRKNNFNFDLKDVKEWQAKKSFHSFRLTYRRHLPPIPTVRQNRVLKTPKEYLNLFFLPYSQQNHLTIFSHWVCSIYNSLPALFSL